MVCHRPRRPARAFTLVELLVVIGIIALLISILLPALSRANDAAKAVKCSANLRSIGQGVLIYANQNKGRLFPFLNDTTWDNPSNKKEFVDAWYTINNGSTPPAMEPHAYWGVPYATAAGLVKMVFNCPASGLTGSSTYLCYGQNGFARSVPNPAPSPSFDDNDRLAWFGTKTSGTSALFETVVSAKGISDYQGNPFVAPGKSFSAGKNLSRIRRSSETIFAFDSVEATMDGNNDMMDTLIQFPDLWQNKGKEREYFRHSGQTKANVLWCDGHVTAIDKETMASRKLWVGPQTDR